MNYKKNLPTIYDVAAHANVSPATVSRVFGKSGYPVSEVTHDKVMAAAISLGYAPAIKATTRLGKKVAVITPNLDNPYYVSLITGLEYSLRLYGILMLLVNSNGDIEIERKTLQDITKQHVCGVIVVPCSDDIEHIKNAAVNGMSVVMLEHDEQDTCCSVNFNYRAGGAMAVQYFVERGCKTIGFIGSPLTRYSRLELFEGFKSELQARGIGLDRRYVYISDKETRANASQGYYNYEHKNAIAQINYAIESKNLPQGIFCANDITAICIMQQLQQKGYQIPGDVSIIGFDNIQFSEITYPALTTIDQCIYEMGSMAADLLTKRLNNTQHKNVSTMLQPKLIVRQSVI